MFGSAIVDIAIGIVFVFLLVSVIASTINEIILSFLNMRGKELLEGLKTLLDDADASGLVKELYNHGQVYGLFKGPFDPKNRAGHLPSYIPSQNFVMAFLDIVPVAAHSLATPAAAAAAAAAAAGGSVPAGPSTTPQAGSPAGSGSSAQVSAPPNSSFNQPPGPQSAQPTILSQEEALFASLRTAAQKLAADPKTGKVGKPLASMLEAAGDDAATLKKSIEDWYNSAMDRVSGWYKYRTQKILFVIGIGLAVSMNVDAINIVKQLSKDSTLRQSIVAAAGAAKQPDGSAGQPIAAQIKQAQTQVDQVGNLGIALGWNHVPDLLDKRPRGPNSIPSYGDWHWGYLNVFLGWFVTALAASLGAPFWFDMLNKIMVVRSTIKPGEKSQQGASKDT